MTDSNVAPDGGELLRLPEPPPLIDYTLVPDGIYKCCVREVRTGTTRAGDERWAVALTIAEGPHMGKPAAWDSLVFSNRGRARARLVFKALGVPTGKKVGVEPNDLVGKFAMVTLRGVEFDSPTGERIKRSEVPYDGWAVAP